MPTPPRACFVVFFLFFCAAAALADLPPSGSEFWVAWPQTADIRSEDPAFDADAQLVLLTESGTPVPVVVQATGLNWSGSISSASPAMVRVPRSLMVSSENTVEPKGIHVSSGGCGEIAVLFRIPGSGSSVGDEALTVLPMTNLGTVYYPDTYHSGFQADDGTGTLITLGSEFVVAAIEDNTRVSWDNPSCPGLVQMTLNRGQVVQHKCPDVLTPSVRVREIVGTRVESDRPVAVFAASPGSKIIDYYYSFGGRDLNVFWCCRDTLLEQMRPVDDWDYEYRTVPFLGNPPWPGDVIRIVAACDGTDVEVDNGTAIRTRTLQAGEYWDLADFDLFAQTFTLTKDPLVIRAGLPVQVTQFMVGWAAAGMGDPSQTEVPGLSRTSRSTRIYFPDGYESHANVIAPSAAVGNVSVDGTPIPAADFQPFPDGLYSWTRLSGLATGQHLVTSPDPAAVTVFGYSLTDLGEYKAGGYSYPAPSGALTEPFPTLIERTDLCELRCPGACLTLDAGPGYVSYDWSTGETVQIIMVCPGATSTYTVDVVDSNGCPGAGRIQVPVLPAPQPVIAGNLDVCEGDCTTLAVTGVFATVTWTTGDTTPTIVFCPTRPSEMVGVAATGDNGCIGLTEVEVRMTPVDEPEMSLVDARDPTACGPGIRVTWSPAVWHSVPADGVYNVYRSEVSCADALARAPLAPGLTATTYFDDATLQGVPYYYVVEAEDGSTGNPCAGGGPHHGGVTASACAPGPVTDQWIQDLPAHETYNVLMGIDNTGDTATFTWPAALPIDTGAGEHFHLYRGTYVLGPFDRVTPEALTAISFTDADILAARLRFYDLRVANLCEHVSVDPRRVGTTGSDRSCPTPELTDRLPLTWHNRGPACPSLMDRHPCAPVDTAGAERHHRFRKAAPGPLVARLLNADPALDIVLYDDALSTCLAWGDQEIRLPDLAPGTYRLVVDSPAGSEGGYAVVIAFY